MHQHIQEISTKAADVGAAGSIATAGVINVADLNTYIQIGAGAVAIFAGLCAAAFHLYRIWDIKRQRAPSE